MQANESDNKFAVHFANAAQPLRSSTMEIIFPENLGLDDIEAVIHKLKKKTFNHPSEKTFADVRDLLKREMNTHNVSKIIEKHNELLGDEWADEKLKNAPYYCGCQDFFRLNSLYENIIQNSPDESLFEHLLKQQIADDRYLNHVIGMAGDENRDNLHRHLITIFKRSEEARRAMERRLQEGSPVWLSIDCLYNQLHEMCRVSLKDKEFDSFVFAHYVMSLGIRNRYCSCNSIPQDMSLDDVDEKGRSFMYYLLSDLSRCQEEPRLDLIKHILMKLKQPTALRITKTVYWERNGVTIYQFLNSFHGEKKQKLKEIFDEVTEETNMPEIVRACAMAISEQNYQKFIDFHSQVEMKELPCRFCGNEIQNMNDHEEIGMLVKLAWESNPKNTNELFRHILKQFGFQEYLSDYGIFGNGYDAIITLMDKLEIILPRAGEYLTILHNMCTAETVDHQIEKLSDIHTDRQIYFFPSFKEFKMKRRKSSCSHGAKI